MVYTKVGISLVIISATLAIVNTMSRPWAQQYEGWIERVVKEHQVDIVKIETGYFKPDNKNPETVEQGTAFFISREGYLITSAHVVAKREGYHRIVNIYLDDSSSTAHMADVIKEDEYAALLKVRGNRSWPAGLTFASNNEISMREPVVSPGFAGGDWSFPDGHITNTHSGRYWIAEIRTSGGSSGAPVIDRCGQVLGVINAAPSGDRLQQTLIIPKALVYGLVSGYADIPKGKCDCVAQAQCEWKSLEISGHYESTLSSPVTSRPECDDVAVAVGLSNERRCLKPGRGEVFTDCADCPEMVVVPTGKFQMGYGDGQVGPRHRVTIPKPIAISKFEVTVGQFEAFVEDTGYDASTDGCNVRIGVGDWTVKLEKSFRQPGYDQNGSYPVTCVSWTDAQEYVTWLSQKTGKQYRLPSEAEWEYSARAGTIGHFSFVSEISTKKANYNGNAYYADNSRPSDSQKAVPVTSFEPNAWGLYQVHGNVSEWVEDCTPIKGSSTESYKDKPDILKQTGAAWTAGDCKFHTLRGGAWYDNPENLRSAYRDYGGAGFRARGIGFRLARSL